MISLPKIIIFILALLNNGILPLQSANTERSDKSFFVSNDVVQNPAFLEKISSGFGKPADFKKHIKCIFAFLIEYPQFVFFQEDYHQNDRYTLIPQFIVFRTFQTFPIPPPSLA